MNWQEKLDQYLTLKVQRWVLIALLIIYAFSLAYQMNRPFIGTSEAFNGMYGIAAWNWLIRGPIELRFTQMTPYGAQVILPEITKNFYLNRPQFFIAPTAFFYWIFGVGEWQTRLAPIVFSLLSLMIFWVLIKRVFQKPWLTVISSLFYIFFPMSIFYGGMLVHDSVAKFFILALFLAVILFEQEQRSRYLIAVCMMTFLGGLMDWPFFFAAAAVWLYIVLKKNYPKRGAVLSLILGISMVSFGVTLLQIWSITHMNPITFLSTILQNRYGGSTFSVLPYIFFMRINFDLLGFSEIGLILALAGAILYFLRYKKDKSKILFLLFLTSPGLLIYLVFYGYAAGHQFMGVHFIPVVAFLAGWGIGRLRNIWQVSAILLLFLISSLWYTANLFAYKSFVSDDFSMLKRANAAVPDSMPICMGENAVNTNIKFYLMPHQLDDVPCVNHSYFVLRQPDSYKKKDSSSSLLQSFFTNNFGSNVRRISFFSAYMIEISKSIPLFKQMIENTFANRDPHEYYPVLAQRTQEFINDNKLQPVDCSTNFCLYKKL